MITILQSQSLSLVLKILGFFKSKMKFFLGDTLFVRYLQSLLSQPEGAEALGHLVFLVEVETASVWQHILFILQEEGGRRGLFIGAK